MPVIKRLPSTSCLEKKAGGILNIRHDSGNIEGDKGKANNAPRITNVEIPTVPIKVHASYRKPGPACKTRPKNTEEVYWFEGSSSYEREERSQMAGSTKRSTIEVLPNKKQLRSKASEREEREEEPDWENLKNTQEKEKSRGRGRPIKTGEFAGLAQAKRELAEAEEQLIRATAEREFMEEEREKRQTRQALAMSLPSSEPSADPVESDRASRIFSLKVLTDGVETIRSVAKRSKNLKGTFQKSLNKTAEAMDMASHKLASLSASGEVLELERENKSLRAEVGSLRKKLEELEKKVETLLTRPNYDKRERALSPSSSMETPKIRLAPSHARATWREMRVLSLHPRGAEKKGHRMGNHEGKLS